MTIKKIVAYYINFLLCSFVMQRNDPGGAKKIEEPAIFM